MSKLTKFLRSIGKPTPVDATDPKTNGHTLEFVKRASDDRPWKSDKPFLFDNKPELLDPTITLDQVVMLLNGDVVYQAHMPSVMDYDGCQALIKGLRLSAVMPDRAGQMVEVGLFRCGEVLFSKRCPLKDELNEWEHVLNELRMFSAVPTL